MSRRLLAMHRVLATAVSLAALAALMSCTSATAPTGRPGTARPSASGSPSTAPPSPPPGTERLASQPPVDPTSSPEWVRLSSPVTIADAQFEAVVPIDGGFVAVGCRLAADREVGTTCEKPAVWFSPDAIAWGPPFDLPIGLGEDGGVATTAVQADFGLVVGGSVRRGDRTDAAIWLSANGASFGRATGEAVQDAVIVGMARLGDRVVAVGGQAFMEMAGFVAWWSDDGLTWRLGADEPSSAFPLGLLADEMNSGLVAWGPSCAVCPGVTHWWDSPDGRSWTALGEAPGLEGSAVSAVTTTEGGYLAAGSAGVLEEQPQTGEWWRSWSDDDWRQGRPPSLPPGFDVRDFQGFGHGTVAAAQGFAGGRNATFIFARGPGEDVWRGLIELPGLVSIELIQHPDDTARIVAIGRSSDPNMPPVTWVGAVDWAP